MTSNIQSIISKLTLQFASNLTKQDKRRLEDYGKNLTGKISLPEEVFVAVDKTLEKHSLVSETIKVYDYLVKNELVKIATSGKATIKLAISYEEFNQLTRYLKTARDITLELDGDSYSKLTL